MLKILGRRTSFNVMKVLWVVDELGLPYEHDNDIGGTYGRNREAPYLALNPNGTVPTVIDDDFVMWESNSICRYLCRKHNSPLFPTELRAAQRVDRWMDWSTGVHSPRMSAVFPPLIRLKPEQRDMKAIAAGVEAWGTTLKILEAQLGRTPYLAGDRLTLAEVCNVALVHRWFKLPIERIELPNIAAWYERVGQNPRARKHCYTELS